MSTGDRLSRALLHLRVTAQRHLSPQRSVASKLTPTEMRLLAIYHSGQ
jgi:hypothetical protein